MKKAFSPDRSGIAFFGVFLVILVFIIILSANSVIVEIRLDNQQDFLEKSLAILSNQLKNITVSRTSGILDFLSRYKPIVDIAVTGVESQIAIEAMEMIRSVYNLSIVYVMATSGDVLACTILKDGSTLKGNNYLFRHYFKAAMAGQNDLFLALGVTTNKRGIYFSAPIISPEGGKPAGVLVLKHELDEIDYLLGTIDNTITVLVSPEGVIFSSGNRDLIFKTIMPLSQEAIDKVKASRQFGNDRFESIDLLPGSEVIPLKGVTTNYFVKSKPVFLQGWRLLSAQRIDPNHPLTDLQKSILGYGSGFIMILTVIISFLFLSIHQRKLAEEKYRTVVENCNEGILIAQEGRIVFANTRMNELTGFSLDQMHGDSLFEIFHPDDRGMIQRYHKARTTGSPVPEIYEARLCDMNENVKWVLLSSVRIVWNGKAASLAFIVDISERKNLYQEKEKLISELQGKNSALETEIQQRIQAEKFARASQEKYQNLLQISPDAVIVTDLVGRITDLSKRTLELHGYNRPEELLGENAIKLLAGHDTGTIPRDVIKVMKSGAFRDQGCQLLRNDGTIFIGEVSATLLRDETGTPEAYIAITRDITQKKRAKDELMEANSSLLAMNEELRSLDELKSNLLSNISHELRTPLVTVKGYNELILSEKSGPINKKQKHQLKIALKGVERLLTLIDNLLDFSKLELGILRIRKDDVDLVAIARENMLLVSHEAELKNITIDTNLPGTPLNVVGDRVKIGQVFTNLLGNAIKFSPDGERILAEISKDEKMNMALCRITNTGVGIPEKALTRIFDKFYQLDSSSTRRHGGTGMGLTISKNLIELHGGSIWAESPGPSITALCFTIPLTGPARIPPNSAE